jgi:hypothetical protein
MAELPASIPFGPLVKGPRGAFASFALELAGRDIGRDFNNDPLRYLLLENLSASTLSCSDRSRMRLGYRVYRDRKFVADLASQPALESLCRSAGTRNIIYTAALGGSAKRGQS